MHVSEHKPSRSLFALSLFVCTTVCFAAPIHQAAGDGDLALVEELLAGDPDLLDLPAEWGWTPLASAVRRGRIEVVRYLIAAGADLSLRTNEGLTPLHWAVWGRGGSPEIVELLLAAGAEINARADDGTAPVHLAGRGSDALLELLVRAGADVNVERVYAVTPLQMIAAKGSADMTRLLLEHGARSDAACANGYTALAFAEEYDHQDVVRELKRAGAERGTGFPELTGDYLGQPLPGLEPEVFAPGICLAPFAPHGGITFSPDGCEMYWAQHAIPIQSLWRMVRSGNRWGEPHLAPFQGGDHDGTACVTADGRRLYFFSKRPVSAAPNAEKSTMIWYVDRTRSGWGEPQMAPEPLNRPGRSVGNLSLARNGNMYFRAEERGEPCAIYRSRLVNGRYVEPEKLGANINSPTHDLGPAIAPDESYLIWSSFRSDGQTPFNELFISFRNPDDTWTPARSMGEKFNRGHTWMPTITPDGRYIFFLRQGESDDEFFWVDARVVEEFRP